MTGEAHWMDPVLMILGGLGVLFMVWLASRGTLLRRRRRHLICPNTHKAVGCTFVQDTLTKEWVDVVECSAFTPEGEIHCSKACLPAEKRSRAQSAQIMRVAEQGAK
jgi:hypothetical protein